jgi:hypothetical protein
MAISPAHLNARTQYAHKFPRKSVPFPTYAIPVAVVLSPTIAIV